MMGITKQYLRYVPTSVFGLIGSHKSNIKYVELRAQMGKFCAVAACENVLIWDLRKAEMVTQLRGEKQEATIVAASPDKRHIAVGYSDGSIAVFNALTGEKSLAFSGHRSSVSALIYDHNGMRLVSGSKDTEVMLWDIVNESGLFRLRGHKGQITGCCFFTQHNVLITSSKDGLIKFWDLTTQHCFKTLTGHRNEVWNLVLVKDETRLITGAGDNELRVWNLHFATAESQESEEVEPEQKKSRITSDKGESGDDDDGDEEDDDSRLKCKFAGVIVRRGKDRALTLAVDSSGTVLGCHGNDHLLELFKICSQDEVRKRVRHRQKKARKKLIKEQQMDSMETDTIEQSITVSVEDEITRIASLRMSAKVHGFDVVLMKSEIKVVVLLNNNTIEQHSVHLESKTDAGCLNKVALCGHRSDVRAVSFSSDNAAILSASGESLKVWNRVSQECIRTMNCGYALCALFTPGDRHVLVATKAGKIQVFDIASAVLLETVDAHEGAVWSICLTPDNRDKIKPLAAVIADKEAPGRRNGTQRGIVSGSADKQIKFWNFEMISHEQATTSSKRLSLIHTRTLQMSEDVLCVKCSHDGRLLAVSLLDNTIKVFFLDTLKFFLSLYGHKLPVLSLDISTDNTLLVSGSADRNVKLWGMDFGDCHKSIFAHDDSIMCVQFIPNTHMFVSCGKDKNVKQWDGDTFEKILTLQGHHGEVWSVAVSPSGNYIVSASHDKSLRLWEKSQEPLVLQEEQEEEREMEYEASVVQTRDTVIPGEASVKEAALAGKKTIETYKAAERLMEAVNVYREDIQKRTMREQEHLGPDEKQTGDLPLHPLCVAYGSISAERLVLEILRKIRSSELEEALLVLPFDYVSDLIKLFDVFFRNGWDVELCSRCLFFMLRVHHAQVTANQSLLPIVDSLRQNVLVKLTEFKDTIGFNLAGLSFLQQMYEEREQVTFFADATQKRQERKKKLKKSERVILTL